MSDDEPNVYIDRINARIETDQDIAANPPGPTAAQQQALAQQPAEQKEE